MPSYKTAHGRGYVGNNCSVLGDAVFRQVSAFSVERMSRAIFGLLTFISFLHVSVLQAAAQTNQASPLGTNLNAINYYTPEQPFLNILKTGSGWTGQTADGTRYSEVQGALNLDTNGYPQSMTGVGPAAGATFVEIDVLVMRTLGISDASGNETAPFYPAGNYVFLYSGTGTFGFILDCVTANIVSSAVGRIVINIPSPSANGCRLQINSMGSGVNYPTNMALIYSPDSTGSNVGANEALYNGGEIFNPTFISRTSGYRTLRFMWWQETLYTVQTNWNQRAIPSQAFWGIVSSPGNVDPMGDGVPVEVMVALCNEIGADGWFNMPPLSTDDYVTQFATLVHATLNSNLKAYVEYGNEIWNNGQLATFSDLITLGEAAFPGYDFEFGAGFYYGILRAVQNGATWKSVWGPDSARVIRVVAGQTGYNGLYGRNSFILSFTAGMYGGNPSNFTGTVAQNVDVFADAPYLFFGTSGITPPDTFTLDQLFTEIFSGGLISGDYPGGLIAQTLNQAAGDLATAQAYGLPLVAYEGGQSLIDSTYTDTALQTLYMAANRDPRMGTAYTTLFNGWKALGGTLFIHLTDIGAYSKFGYWGALENVLQTSSPKYDALMNFISANPCWWSNCAY